MQFRRKKTLSEKRKNLPRNWVRLGVSMTSTICWQAKKQTPRRVRSESYMVCFDLLSERVKTALNSRMTSERHRPGFTFWKLRSTL